MISFNFVSSYICGIYFTEHLIFFLTRMNAITVLLYYNIAILLYHYIAILQYYNILYVSCTAA